MSGVREARETPAERYARALRGLERMKLTRWERAKLRAKDAIGFVGLALLAVLGAVSAVVLWVVAAALSVAMLAAPFILVIFAAIWAWRNL